MNIERKAYVEQIEFVIHYLNRKVRKNLIKKLEELSEQPYDDKVKEKMKECHIRLDANYKLLETMRSFIELNKVL
jgi:hypothetical protein